MSSGTPPAVPRPASSVMLVRDSAPDAAEPLEVYMIRRHRGMKFLGGYYAFPGGKVDAADAGEDILMRCRGITPDAAAVALGTDAEVAPLAFWVTAVRELLEETGILLACDERGCAVDGSDPAVVDSIAGCRKELMAGASFAELLARHRWFCDLRPLRYLSHFITPRTSPIRFSARFFLCPVPPGQTPQLFTEETSEAFWIHPGQGYRRFMADDMAMAEPAEYGLGYLAQFASLDELWACSEGVLTFRGIVDRIDVFWKNFDWKANRWVR